ncbi:hypothetical protein HJC23_010607 [Cyclotella cryptica]|uniref:cGMP-dependent protein kinase n=1 Tax=Cyclotella cryptica TaxID=29204 RepID=A0ABD3PQ19_9STRA|eukprot:CCRYP_012815-RA/>CCRYP_012815-RA protein AED:0.14 eAED:0.14 QI:0/0/0/1/1/1/2/0/617
MGTAMSVHCSRKSSSRTEILLARTAEFLKHTPFHRYLTPENIQEFATCFLDTLKSPPGKKIDLDSQRIYIVAEGQVDLSTTYPEGLAKVEAAGYLCRKREGDIIFLKHTKENVRTKIPIKNKQIQDLSEDIIVTGSGDSEILLLCADMMELDNFIKNHPNLTTVIENITTTQIEDKLLLMPFLQHVPPSKLCVFAAMCRYEALDSGQTVFEEDDQAEKLYLVLSGVAQVIAKETPATRVLHAIASKKNLFSEQSVALQRSLECSCQKHTLEQSTEIVIAELKSGDYFGETGLIFNIDRTCKVRTSEKALFLTVHKMDFRNFLKICPMEKSLEVVIKERMVSKLSSLAIPFLSGIPQEMYCKLTDSVTINAVPKDHVIFRQGDVGDKFYIIVHGSVHVTANTESEESDSENEFAPEAKSESRLGTLTPGQYFGEMALVKNNGNNLRRATVTSSKKSILLSIDKESFHTIFESNSDALAEFELRVLKSHAQLCHILKHTLGRASFRDFLEKEHAGENIDFWVAATSFANEFPQLSNGQSQARAKQIFLTFCTEYADRQVNLPHKVMLELDSLIHGEGDLTPDVFNSALSEIYKLMEKDNFRRYKASKDFKDYLGGLGIL